MPTVCGRPQGGGGSGPCGRMWTGGSQKRGFFVDVINGWPLWPSDSSKQKLIGLKAWAYWPIGGRGLQVKSL